MKFAYNRGKRYFVRDSKCFGRECFIPRLIKEKVRKKHPLVGHGKHRGKYRVCETLYNLGWKCPDERFSLELYREREKAGWTIKDW